MMPRALGSTVKASISMIKPAPNREETVHSCNFDTRDLSMATARFNLRIWIVLAHVTFVDASASRIGRGF